jgi:hypothetical protein
MLLEVGRSNHKVAVEIFLLHGNTQYILLWNHGRHGYTPKLHKRLLRSSLLVRNNVKKVLTFMIKLGVRVSGVLVYVCHRPKHIMSLLTKLLLIWQDKFFLHAQISITRTGTVLLKIYGLPTYSMKHLSSKRSKHLLQYNVFFFLFPFLVFFLILRIISLSCLSWQVVFGVL